MGVEPKNIVVPEADAPAPTAPEVTVSNIVGGKRIMKLIGLDLGQNRVPFRNMTDEEEASMKRELEQIGFFERCNRF